MSLCFYLLRVGMVGAVTPTLGCAALSCTLVCACVRGCEGAKFGNSLNRSPQGMPQGLERQVARWQAPRACSKLALRVPSASACLESATSACRVPGAGAGLVSAAGACGSSLRDLLGSIPHPSPIFTVTNLLDAPRSLDPCVSLRACARSCACKPRYAASPVPASETCATDGVLPGLWLCET